MSLKESCRERIFNVLAKITEKSKYVVMIVDSNAYKLLSFICKNEELLEKGISLIELINTQRNSLQDFDCIYFLSSNAQSVNCMLSDFKNEKEAKYKNIHILFTSNIEKNSEILPLIANSDFILKRIKSCACINLNFLAYESRIFYFENNLNIYDYYPLKNTDILFDISSKLLSVCSCLKISPIIRYQDSELCRKLSEVFYNTISNAEVLNDNTSDDDLILILDRSIDCSTLFIHEYSYQSLCYDMLKIKTSYEESNGDEEDAHTVFFEVTNNDQKKEEKKAILSEHDEIWLKYRHCHMQDVNEVIKNEISAFSEKNAVAKIQKKQFLNPSDALNALRSLPQYETMIERYWLHVYLCNSCFNILQKKNIVDIGLIEQNICCNVDKHGKELSYNKNTASVNSIITSNEYDQEEKARLLLLYFINYAHINEYDQIKMIESAELGLFMQKMVNGFLKLKLHINNIYIEESNSSNNKIHHILDKNKNKIKYYKNIAKNSKYELTRHEPNIKDIILQITDNTLHKGKFPFIDDIDGQNIKQPKFRPEKKQNVLRGTLWDFKTETGKLIKDKKKKKIVVFIIGGITYSEIRHIYEMSENLNIDIYLGGTELLTSNVILNQFKKLSNF